MLLSTMASIRQLPLMSALRNRRQARHTFSIRQYRAMMIACVACADCSTEHGCWFDVNSRQAGDVCRCSCARVKQAAAKPRSCRSSF